MPCRNPLRARSSNPQPGSALPVRVLQSHATYRALPAAPNTRDSLLPPPATDRLRRPLPCAPLTFLRAGRCGCTQPRPRRLLLPRARRASGRNCHRADRVRAERAVCRRLPAQPRQACCRAGHQGGGGARVVGGGLFRFPCSLAPLCSRACVPLPTTASGPTPLAPTCPARAGDSREHTARRRRGFTGLRTLSQKQAHYRPPLPPLLFCRTVWPRTACSCQRLRPCGGRSSRREWRRSTAEQHHAWGREDQA